MAVKIRLKRTGAKKNPFYRIVVADSKSARDSKVIEELGSYNPKSDEKMFNVDKEKAARWIRNGAQPTETVRSLFKAAGIISADQKAKQSEPVADANMASEAAE